MARWQSKTIGENPTLKEIANKADIAITAVQGGLEFVKVAGEGAKLLISAGPEAALALTAVPKENPEPTPTGKYVL